MERPPGVLSAGWVRLSLLFVVLAVLLGGGVPLLSKWKAASQVVVLRPAPAESLQAPALQSPTSVALSSPLPENEGPWVARPEDLGATPLEPPSTPAPETGLNEGEARFRIQVGAFTDAHHAERLEGRLRAAHLPVYRATVPRTLTLYQLRVNPNGRANDLAKRLRDLGLSLGTLQEGDGALLIAPPLPMKRATDLAERLKSDGMDVELRRIDRKALVYVVRVGEYPSAAAAAAAQADLKELGHEGIIVRE